MSEPLTQAQFDEIRQERRDSQLAQLHTDYSQGLQSPLIKMLVRYCESEVAYRESIMIDSGQPKEAKEYAEIQRNFFRGIADLSLLRRVVNFYEREITDEYERSGKLAREAEDALARANRGEGDPWESLLGYGVGTDPDDGDES